MDANNVNLKKLARDLYQVGLDLGLTPDEAARLTTTMALPFSSTRTVVEEGGRVGCQRLSRDTYPTPAQLCVEIERRLSTGKR
jgi:hypothetical protein